MQFENEAQSRCYSELARLLPQAMGDNPYWADPDAPRFHAGEGSLCNVPVTIATRRAGTAGAVIEVFCRLVSGVQPSIEAYEPLLEENVDNPWGAMALDHGEVLLRRTLHASTLTAAEIQESVGNVSAFAAVAFPQLAAIGTMPAGWYSDPQGRTRLRYWNGSAWTQDVSA